MRLLPTAILGWLIFGPMGTLLAIGAVVWFSRGEYVSAVVAIGVSAFCFGLIIPLVKVVRGTVTPHADFDDTGTTVRPDRGIDIPVQVSLLGLVVASALIAIFAPPGKLAIPVPGAMRFYLPFVSAVVAVTGASISLRMLRRGSSKYLRLTCDGFELAQGRRTQSGEWAQVQDVTDSAPGEQNPTPSAVVVVMSGGNAASLAAASTTPDGRALRDWVRFYWLNPDQRDELTDGRAVERLAGSRAGP